MMTKERLDEFKAVALRDSLSFSDEGELIAEIESLQASIKEIRKVIYRGHWPIVNTMKLLFPELFKKS